MILVKFPEAIGAAKNPLGNSDREPRFPIWTADTVAGKLALKVSRLGKELSWIDSTAGGHAVIVWIGEPEMATEVRFVLKLEKSRFVTVGGNPFNANERNEGKVKSAKEKLVEVKPCSMLSDWRLTKRVRTLVLGIGECSHNSVSDALGTVLSAKDKLSSPLVPTNAMTRWFSVVRREKSRETVRKSTVTSNFFSDVVLVI